MSIATPAPAPPPAGMPAPASLAEALAMRRAADSYLAAADPTDVTVAEQADALIQMEQGDAIATAARAWFLGAFISAQGPAADADGSARAWLIHKTGVTGGCAGGRVGWSRRVQAHPLVAAALAEGGRVSESMGKVISDYTDKLPAADRDAADAILLGVARAGARQDDIARLAAQMYKRCRSGTPDEDPGDPDGRGAPDGRGGHGDPDGSGASGSDPDALGGPDGDLDGAGDGSGGLDGGPGGADDSPGGPGVGPDDPDDEFDDRSVRLDTTLGGAGVLYGDLSPDCAALVKTVLDALSAPAGPEDTRGKAQRWHDALADAMRRLLAEGLVPGQAGPAIRALVHIAFAELRLIRGASGLEQAWVARAQQDWAGHRAAAAITGGDGGAWLNGGAARGAYCDAMAVPVVTGTVNPAVLDRLVGLCLQLAGHGQTGTPEHGGPGQDAPQAGTPGSPLTEHARAMLQRAVIGAAVDLVSGPGGLASVLRTGLLTARLAGPSLPLDVGFADTVPAGIRQAVLQRSGGHCEWAGDCRQPAAGCHIHHVIRKADGGKTSVKTCVLLCSFHHLVAVHRWGWRLILNLDGTTTAFSPDGSKVLHSHGPPPQPG
ncbi:MAG: HNH endonuclease [Streptosporangiaceae bacterium]